MGRIGKKIKMKVIRKVINEKIVFDLKNKFSIEDTIRLYPNIAMTSILHVLIVPDNEDVHNYSPFQGYNLNLFDPKYIALLHLMSIMPSTANEVYMNQDELIDFRNGYSTSTYLILDKSSFAKRIGVFDGLPFIYCYCIDEDVVQHVNDVCEGFKYQPITVGWADTCNVVIDDDFRTFSLDESICERLSVVRTNGVLPEKAESFFYGSCRRKGVFHDINLPSYNHAVTNPNEAVLYSLGFKLPNQEKLKSGADKSPYIEAMISSSNTVKEFGNTNVQSFSKSDLVLYCPSIYTHLYDFNSQFWNNIKRKEKSKVVRDFIMNGLFKNPSYSGFNFSLKNEQQSKELQKSGLVRQIEQIRKFELQFSSAAINFLAVSNNAPALRLPNKLNFYHSSLRDIESLSKSGSQQSETKLKRKFDQLTSSMKDEIGEDLCEYIVAKSSSLTLCSDSILEWVCLDRIPLMFTHEISKISTTPGNKFLQEATNFSSFSLSRKQINSITVIRSFNSNDPIKYVLEEVINTYIDDESPLKIEFKDVSNVEEFVEAVNSCSDNILILDCHGNHGGEDSHGWLQIGSDRVDTWILPVIYPPIVILSACLTAAIGGSHASVANGFLSKGSLSVLGTLLPVDAYKSANFIGSVLSRISNYLNELVKLDVPMITWRKFLTDFLRVSYCHDFLLSFRDETKIISHELYIELYKCCQEIIISRQECWYDNVLIAMQEICGIEANVLDLEVQKLGLTETMLYSQLGRPENIIIDLTIS
ncbi:hypothetical protein AB6E87_02030 [Vibrio sp. 10N.247.311.64]|uniref:hypothetical protein n=1 Tax=Vibrio sp. 10N.247.311.64 TaxID=3229997 RepID=UPI00354D0E78